MKDGRGLVNQNWGFLAMPRIYDLDRMGDRRSGLQFSYLLVSVNE
jgi:hypothetical protein